MCSTATVFSCDDVLGNAQYNVDPFGISGLIGSSPRRHPVHHQLVGEPTPWAESYMKYGMYMTGAACWSSLFSSLMSSHGENLSVLYDGSHRRVVCLFGFWKAGKMHDAGEWSDAVLDENSKGKPEWK